MLISVRKGRPVDTVDETGSWTLVVSPIERAGGEE